MMVKKTGKQHGHPCAFIHSDTMLLDLVMHQRKYIHALGIPLLVLTSDKQKKDLELGIASVDMALAIEMHTNGLYLESYSYWNQDAQNGQFEELKKIISKVTKNHPSQVSVILDLQSDSNITLEHLEVYEQKVDQLLSDGSVSFLCVYRTTFQDSARIQKIMQWHDYVLCRISNQWSKDFSIRYGSNNDVESVQSSSIQGVLQTSSAGIQNDDYRSFA